MYLNKELQTFQNSKEGVLIIQETVTNKLWIVLQMFPGRHRWVIYTTEMNGKNTMWEVDGSMVPAEWYDLKVGKLK